MNLHERVAEYRGLAFLFKCSRGSIHSFLVEYLPDHRCDIAFRFHATIKRMGYVLVFVLLCCINITHTKDKYVGQRGIAWSSKAMLQLRMGFRRITRTSSPIVCLLPRLNQCCGFVFSTHYLSNNNVMLRIQ